MSPPTFWKAITQAVFNGADCAAHIGDLATRAAGRIILASGECQPSNFMQAQTNKLQTLPVIALLEVGWVVSVVVVMMVLL